MELTNEFEVAVPVEQAWAVLTDVERIAPCLPGAELQEVEGDEYRGVVKVKVGPITASYKGAARFEELDATTHRAVLKAEGRETRGQGNASATITAAMEPAGSGTKVMVTTDLAITGKVAQFGRGVLADVSGKLLGQFVHNLETTVLGKSEPEATPAPSPAAEKAAEAAAGNGAPRSRSRKAPSVIKARDAAPTDAPEGGTSSAGTTPAPATAADAAAAGDTAPAPAAAGDTAPATAATDATATDDAASDKDASDKDGSKSPEEAPRPAIRQIQSAPVEPVDLVGMAGPSLAKRLWPYASAAGILFLARIVIYALRRRKK